MTIATIIFESEVKTSLPTFKKDDYGDTIVFNILNEDGSAHDLTGKTVVFKAKKLNDFNEFLFTNILTVTDATGGVCQLTFVSSDLSETGSYDGQLIISEASVSNKTIVLGYLNIN